MSPTIRTQGLSKRFRRTEAVNDLFLEVPPGSIYALVGPNGAGKTTTIKVLMNILQPSGGHSEVLDVDSRKLGPPQFAQIGYVSENQDLPEWMTVGYFMRFLRPFYPTWDDALAEELLRQFDLPRDRKLHQLSRGMRMKTALASSLAYRPKLIVLDEPFTGLDALVRDELIEGLLARAENTTILISSHDLAEIESFASHVGYLDQGRLQFSEELETLTGRFREIVLTFDGPQAIPKGVPATWMQVEAVGPVVRFVDTAFHPERTPALVRGLFPDVRDVAENGMPLRSIFVSLAKSSGAAA
ncbi:ABC transporter related protein [Candidatus Sulfopaludibacter sp. SbA3]|nr:ABC transporter related protein [Candidatus Sulfopaludibacter sp. SbA3]